MKFADLRLRLREVERDSVKARTELREIQTAQEIGKKQFEAEISALQTRNTQVEHELEQWRAAAESRSDYDTIKSELAIFKVSTKP
jgi:hypothetical protein